MAKQQGLREQWRHRACLQHPAALMRNEVIEIVRQVIDAVDGKLPDDNIRDARRLLDHNECGLPEVLGSIVQLQSLSQTRPKGITEGIAKGITRAAPKGIQIFATQVFSQQQLATCKNLPLVSRISFGTERGRF